MFLFPRVILIVNIDKDKVKIAVWQVVTQQIVYPGYQITVNNNIFAKKNEKRKKNTHSSN